MHIHIQMGVQIMETISRVWKPYAIVTDLAAAGLKGVEILSVENTGMLFGGFHKATRTRFYILGWEYQKRLTLNISPWGDDRAVVSAFSQILGREPLRKFIEFEEGHWIYEWDFAVPKVNDVGLANWPDWEKTH